MKKISTVLLFFLIYNVSAQRDSLQIKHKKQFVSVSKTKDSNIDILSEKIILDNDTLFNINANKNIRSHFPNDFFNDEKFIKQYKTHAFGSSYVKKTNNRSLMQWVTPIVIFIDTSLPKQIKSEFSVFINQLQGINNLNISITKKINDANYFISVVDEKVTGYTEDDLEYYDTFEREELTYRNLTYQLIANYNNIYGGTLKINRASTKKDIYTIGKLKKAFFISLGQFTDSFHSGNGSLINYSNKYVISDTISPYDLKILRMHYHNIHDLNINIITFNNIEKLIKNEN